MVSMFHAFWKTVIGMTAMPASCEARDRDRDLVSIKALLTLKR